jgi:hypothetical protein
MWGRAAFWVEGAGCIALDWLAGSGSGGRHLAGVNRSRPGVVLGGIVGSGWACIEEVDAATLEVKSSTCPGLQLLAWARCLSRKARNFFLVVTEARLCEASWGHPESLQYPLACQ